MKLDRLRERFFEGVPRYRWLETIGRGGMGIVFKAHDLDLDEVVAIKVLSPDLDADDNELLIRFKREINLNRKIKHPNVARIHDFGTSGDFPYITMEYVPGQDLRTFIHGHKRLAPGVSLSILRQIALGTAAAHKLGIVHRDLKSQNVMIDESGAVAILDFGLARGMLNDRVTMDSIMIGTPHYMSPEQALGRPADARSDIYSIGVIAYECLTGQVPFNGDSPLVIAMAHVSEAVPEEPLVEAGTTPELRAIIVKALAKQAPDRYQTAAELEAELASLNEQGTPREVVSAPEPARPLVQIPTPLPTSPTRPAEFRTQAVSPPLPSPPPVVPAVAPPPVYAEARVFAPLGSAATTAASSVAAAATAAAVVAAAGAPQPAQAAAPPKPVVRDREPIVLVVENDPEARERAVRFMAQHGCKTMSVGSGQASLETLLKHVVDLILLSVKLPDMDGFDVTRIIKSQATSAMIPVVLMSDRLDRNRFAFGIQSGATDFLAKPLALDSMMSRVWAVLQHRGFVPPANNAALQQLLRKIPPPESSGTHARII